MMQIAKYYSEEELKKIRNNKPVTSSAKALSNDEVYDQELINGGVGVDPTIKYMMDQARGIDNGPLSMYHSVSSSGMQAI